MHEPKSRDQRGRRRWRDLTRRQKIALSVSAVVQFGLAGAAWADLARRAPAQVRGPKWPWAALIAVNYAGPIAYFRWGRRRPDNRNRGEASAVTGEDMMSGYTIQATCELPFEEAVAAVRAELARAGFGVITEIDLRATLRQKIGAEIPAEVILGACNPRFAHRAICVDPSVAALLPCNVVVRSLGDRSTLVEAFDPGAMMQLAGGHGDLEGIAAEVAQQLRTALAAVPGASRAGTGEAATGSR